MVTRETAELFSAADSADNWAESLSNQTQAVLDEAQRLHVTEQEIGDVDAIDRWADDAIERAECVIDELRRVKAAVRELKDGA